MPEIKLTNITKRYGNFYAVDNLNLDIEDNAFITLLGPSGCGKTTTLRMIAGLETPTSGQIKIGDRVVFDSEKGINVPPNKRKVGFLFQNYALWPNMTVYQNISFGLTNIKEKMPLVDIKALKLKTKIEALKHPKELKDIYEESRNKDGKVDIEKVYLKLIDTYSMSMYSAKEFYSLGVMETVDTKSAADDKRAVLEKELEDIVKAHEAKGETLSDKCEILKGGQAVENVRSLTKEEIDLAVRRVSRIVKIGMFMNRYPAELSGGQQQRVAIARTLAPEPQVLFMDEPLSNLDAKLRLEMRYELQRLHLETGSTFVYVTHDQMEAMTLATRICLINNGVLQQYAAPLSVYNRPENLFVADFVGNPSMNFVEAKGVQEAGGELSLNVLGNHKAVFKPSESLDLGKWFEDRDAAKAKADAELELKKKDKKYVEKNNKDESFRYHISLVEERDDSLDEEPVITNEDFVIGIRPEFIELDEGEGGIEGELYGVMPTGMESTIKIAVGNFLLTGVVFGSKLFQIGAKHNITVSGDGILLFDRKSGKCIASGSLELE
jgi:ABC-type sugar transport system ATPase subunit